MMYAFNEPRKLQREIEKVTPVPPPPEPEPNEYGEVVVGGWVRRWWENPGRTA